MDDSGKPRTSYLAVASLILGVVAVLTAPYLWISTEMARARCGPPMSPPEYMIYINALSEFASPVSGFFAVLTGIIGAAEIRLRQGKLTGERKARAGIVLGVSGFFLWFLLMPNLVRLRKLANESSAAGLLRVIAKQQGVFRGQREIDEDGDGIGEYGLLCELCGEIPLRPQTGTKVADPIYLSTGFQTAGAAGRSFATKTGYHFRIYLPASPTTAGDDKSLGGTPNGKGGPAVDSKTVDLQEKHFVVYAWPEKYCRTGQRTLVINEAGQICRTWMEKTLYSGDKGPSVEAAFSKSGDGSDGWLNDKLGGVGNDGNRWELERY